MAEIETLTIKFDTKIAEAEIPLLRGAIIHTAESSNVLFHNHTENNYRYQYPLIQYKRINEKAALVCIGKGIEAVEDFFSNNTHIVRLGHKHILLPVEEKSKNTVNLHIADNVQYIYDINHYLPLNQKNYVKYQSIDSIVDRYTLIEKCLIGNILSFAKSMDTFFNDKIQIVLTDVKDINLYQYKKIKMLGFDLTFKTNVLLPEFIGLGKEVSLGYGTITRK